MEIYPEEPRPWVELTKLEVATVFDKIPWTVDVKLRVEIYPEEPRPCVELTKFIDLDVRIPWTVDVRLSVEIYPEEPRPVTEDTDCADVIPAPVILFAMIP